MLNKILIWLSIFHAALFIGIIYCFDGNTIPIHYNVNGYADMYGNKWILLIQTFVPLILSILFYFYNKAPRKSRPQNYKKYENFSISSTIIFFIVISWLSVVPLFTNSNYIDEYWVYCLILAMALFIISISIPMPKLEQNKTFGIKTPWTFKDKTVWYKTHKLAGIWGQRGGFTIIVVTIAALIFKLKILCISVLITVVVLCALVPPIYSYILYKKLPEKI